MSLDPFPSGFGRSFDDIFERFLGGDPFGRTRPVQRVDISRLLSEQARELLTTAGRAAGEWGSADVDVEHLLWAATQMPPTREILEGVGVDVDALAEQMESLAGHDENHEGTLSLTPAAKRAQFGVIAMRAICSYMPRTFCSNSAAASGSMLILAMARYSSTTPSTISTLARPRMDKARAPPGVSPASMETATSGRAERAATFGEVVAVATITWLPVQ